MLSPFLCLSALLLLVLFVIVLAFGAVAGFFDVFFEQLFLFVFSLGRVVVGMACFDRGLIVLF